MVAWYLAAASLRNNSKPWRPPRHKNRLCAVAPVLEHMLGATRQMRGGQAGHEVPFLNSI